FDRIKQTTEQFPCMKFYMLAEFAERADVDQQSELLHLATMLMPAGRPSEILFGLRCAGRSEKIPMRRPSCRMSSNEPRPRIDRPARERARDRRHHHRRRGDAGDR